MKASGVVIDGLQYSAWSRTIFEQMHEGGLNAVHVTLAYHENTRETLTRRAPRESSSCSVRRAAGGRSGGDVSVGGV